jgi:hypothetical protein
MKTDNRFVCRVACGVALAGFCGTAALADDFVWTGLASTVNYQHQMFLNTANWTNSLIPNAAGATVVITSWPTNGNAAYGGVNGIQLQYAPRTFGTLKLAGTGVLCTAFSPTFGRGAFVMDNNGAPAEIVGVGPGSVTVKGPVDAPAELRLIANDLSNLGLSDYVGPGLLTVVGRTDGGTNTVTLWTFNTTNLNRAVTIESGAVAKGWSKASEGAYPFPASVTNILLNGILAIDDCTRAQYMNPGNTLCGTGLVRMVMRAGYDNNTYRRLSVTNSTTVIAPGDGGVGTLTFTGINLRLWGGTYEFDVGETASDQVIVSAALDVGVAPGTVRIKDGKRLAKGIVPLFSYGSITTGANLTNMVLELPAQWVASLTNNATSKTIDLDITQLSPRGTVVFLN